MFRIEDTLGVNMAAFANLGMLVNLLNIGVGATTLPGYIIAACVLPAALAFEGLLLRRWTQRHIRILQSPAPRP